MTRTSASQKASSNRFPRLLSSCLSHPGEKIPPGPSPRQASRAVRIPGDGHSASLSTRYSLDPDVPMKIKPALSPGNPTGRSLAVVTLVFLVVFFTAGAAWSADSGEPVARVNGVTIYQSDLFCAVEASLARKLSSPKKEIEENRPLADRVDNEKALNRLVDIELLYQESLKHRFHGIVEESDKRYQQEVTRLGGEDRLVSALQCNNMSAEDFRKAIFRNLSIKRLLDKVVYSRIQISDEEIKDYYEQNRDKFQRPESVRIRQILVKGPPGPGDDNWRHAESRALTIYRDASTGADFIRLARRHSDDPVTASAGGDMGSIQMENLQGIFDTVLPDLEVGSITKPIRSRQGFHIVKVVSITPSSTKTLDEVQEHITTQLRRTRARVMISRLVSDLRSKAEIKIFQKQ